MEAVEMVESGQVGFVMDETAQGQVFFEYFGFPCHSLHRLPSSSTSTSSTIRSYYDRPMGFSVTVDCV
jgi:hypothetical protein